MAITTCFSFRKGMSQVPEDKIEEVRKGIMEALKIKGRMTWYTRLNGLVEPRMSEADKIREVFSRYGITEIWGE